MAERGVSGSGVELAAQLQSSQSSANRAQQEGQALEAEKYRRALQGMSATGSLAGTIREEEFGEQSEKASASDRIAQFNALQRAGAQQRNIAQQRGIAAQKTSATQQAFQNELAKKQAQAAAYTGAGQQAGQQAAGQQDGALQEWSAGPQLLSSVLGAGAVYASDINAKKEIKPADGEIDKMLNNLEPSSYEYKEPEKFGQGRQVGVMAQDLEKSRVGEQFVEDDIDGNGTKGINYGQMAPAILASQVKLNKDNKDLKSKVEQLTQLLEALRK